MPIYLDYNATTPIHPDVVEAMLPYLTVHFGNPSSGHAIGQYARKAVDTAREQVAALLGCEPGEIVFTSGGTEANNLAIRGVAATRPAPAHIVSSNVEHPATSRPCSRLVEEGWRLSLAKVDARCRLQADEVATLLAPDTALVTIMLANNETGTLMPIRAIADSAHARGILVHSDAAQAVGKIPTRVRELNVDLLSVAGHKLYAPKGVGALYVRKGTRLLPLLLGAGHESGMRPGTENVASIVGLGVACEIAASDQAEETARVRSLRDDLHERLNAIPGLSLNGHLTDRLPNTLNVSLPGVRASAVLGRASRVAASTGSACHEGGESPSAVLIAMGVAPEVALGALRLTLGRFVSPPLVAEAAAALIEAWHGVVRGKNSN